MINFFIYSLHMFTCMLWINILVKMHQNVDPSVFTNFSKVFHNLVEFAAQCMPLRDIQMASNMYSIHNIAINSDKPRNNLNARSRNGFWYV